MVFRDLKKYIAYRYLGAELVRQRIFLEFIIINKPGLLGPLGVVVIK